MAITKVTSGGISDIAAAVEGASDSNKFTDADHTKLNAIEASATADQTKSDIEGLGIDVPAANLTGTVADARISVLTASKLTGALPAIDGASLTAINASNLGSGTVPSARLGSGTASSSTFLRGDSTYAEAGGGKVVQMKSMRTGSTTYNNSSGTVTLDSLTFSNAHTSGNGVFIGYPIQTYIATANTNDAWIHFKVFDGSTELDSIGSYYFTSGAVGYANNYACQHFAAINSNATLTVKITAGTNGGTNQTVNSQDNAYGFWVQEIQA